MMILSEECAEVIQAISKCHRFGLDHYKPGKARTNREHLEEELGDLLAMIQILQDTDIVDREKLQEAKSAKFKKLRCWSNIEVSVLNGLPGGNNLSL